MKRQSISKKLFKAYALIFSISVTVLSLFFVSYVVVDMNKKIISTQEQMITNINKNVENFFKEINDFSRMLINSEQFREITISQLPNAYDEGKHLGGYFAELYLLAYRMIENDYKVGVYTNSGHYIWLGNNYFIQEIDQGEVIQDKTYDYSQVEYLKKNPYLNQIRQSHFVRAEMNKESICLSRMMDINNRFQAPQARLEVYVDYKQLIQLMEQVLGNAEVNGSQLYVYNQEGQQLYGGGNFSIDPYIKEGVVQSGMFRFKGEQIRIEPICGSQLYVIATIPMGSMYVRLMVYLVFAMVLICIVNAIFLGITYKISIKLTAPIQEMCRQLKKIEFQHKETEQMCKVYTDIDELDFLAENIRNLQHQLRESLGKIIKLESYELQSKMLALQAQMQPHFLYNTLMTIGAMGEEQGNQEVANMCYHMTYMLRYISSQDIKEVMLADEMSHVEAYIGIMKERFYQLQVDYDIPLELMELKVPKLIIQPLVENSIKYCGREDCKVEIDGWRDEKTWGICIKDNGIGFEDKKLEEVLEGCEKALLSQEIQLNIKGMGIANIYTRLKLFYGEDLHFKIFNMAQGGCCVEVGAIVGERGKDVD